MSRRRQSGGNFKTEVVKPAAGYFGRKLMEVGKKVQDKYGQMPVAVAAIKTADKPVTVVSATATAATPNKALAEAVSAVKHKAQKVSATNKKIPTYKTPQYAKNYVSPYRQTGKKGGRRRRRTKSLRKRSKRSRH